MCGEHLIVTHGVTVSRGSSPRVRGTCRASIGSWHRHGIIPACAGNMCCSRRCCSCRWDHPRVCGEHRRGQVVEPQASGSSPRVRGTSYYTLSNAVGTGIIPACAGNIIPTHFAHNSARDHPRVCGEHSMAFDPKPAMVGSSPRVRGTSSSDGSPNSAM